jgi:hypothetical protein
MMCREKGDATTANLFEEILADEEHHIDYIETNLELMDSLGDQLYLAQLVDQPPDAGLAITPCSAARSPRRPCSPDGSLISFTTVAENAMLRVPSR